MDLKITKEKEDKLLKRTEIEFEVDDAEKTPARVELRRRIAALKNAKEELVSIYWERQCFGEHRATGKAFIYSDEGTFKSIEPKFLAEREIKGGKKKGKGEEAQEEKGAEKKEEAKSEKPEKKEAKPAEKPAEKAEKK
jgi:ribosomal protein S24E